jgi:hypothetical protein
MSILSSGIYLTALRAMGEAAPPALRAGVEKLEK